MSEALLCALHILFGVLQPSIFEETKSNILSFPYPLLCGPGQQGLALIEPIFSKPIGDR